MTEMQRMMIFEKARTKSMKVECIERFNDVTQPTETMRRNPGDIFEVGEDRGKYLVGIGMVKEAADQEIAELKKTENKEKVQR